MRAQIAVGGGVLAGMLAGVEGLVRGQALVEVLASAGAVALVSMVFLAACIGAAALLGCLGPDAPGGAHHHSARGILAAIAVVSIAVSLASLGSRLALGHRDTRLIALVVAVCGVAMTAGLGFLVEPAAGRLGPWLAKMRLPTVGSRLVAVSGLVIVLFGTWSVHRLGTLGARPAGIAGRILDLANASTDLDADGRGILPSDAPQASIKKPPAADR